MKNRNKLLILIISLGVITLGYVFINSLMNSQKIVISTKNVKEVAIFSKDNQEKPLKTFGTSEKTIRLEKGDYVIKYTGTDGYADGKTNISLKEEPAKFDINPKFSEIKLAGMLKTEKQAIDTAILSQIKGVQQYNIKAGALYEYGDWYGTVLTYGGEDFYNADSLRLIMKKEDKNWVLKTNPPEIILTKAIFPEIPEEVLEAVNIQPDDIPSRYTATD